MTAPMPRPAEAPDRSTDGRPVNGQATDQMSAERPPYGDSLSGWTRILRLAARQGWTELTQFRRSWQQVVFTLAFPVILLALFGSIFTGQLTGGATFTQYFVTGMIATALMTTGFQALAIQISIERDKGVLKRFRGTPMPRTLYFAGKVIMVVVLAVAEMAVLLLFALVFYGVRLPDTAARWATLTWVSVLGITACTLCGIAFSSIARGARSAPALVTPVALLLQFTSGVFVVFTNLPPWMQRVAAIFPLKWLCQGMRSVFLPDGYARAEPAGSWELGRVALVLAGWCVLGLALCLWTFRWTSEPPTRTGSRSRRDSRSHSS